MENETKKPIWMIIVAIIITTVIFGGGIYYWQNKKLTDSKNDLNNQIATLQNQVNGFKATSTRTTTATAPATTTIPTTATDATANWKTYTNDSYGLSFKYLQKYSIDTEKNFKAGLVGNMTLIDKTRTGTPTIQFQVPDGRGGPQPTDILYDTIIENGKITINNRTVVAKNKGNDDSKTYIEFEIGKLYNDANGKPYANLTTTSANGILVWMIYTSGDYEQEFKDIISTIKITKPEIYGTK